MMKQYWFLSYGCLIIFKNQNQHSQTHTDQDHSQPGKRNSNPHQMIYSQIKVPLNNRKILNQIKISYSNFLGKYGKNMQHGDERNKRQKNGSDIIYHVGCFWYGL
ncbi:hypothetical protein ACB098_05G034100 [Castanea mollissima]